MERNEILGKMSRSAIILLLLRTVSFPAKKRKSEINAALQASTTVTVCRWSIYTTRTTISKSLVTLAFRQRTSDPLPWDFFRTRRREDVVGGRGKKERRVRRGHRKWLILVSFLGAALLRLDRLSFNFYKIWNQLTLLSSFSTTSKNCFPLELFL